MKVLVLFAALVLCVDGWLVRDKALRDEDGDGKVPVAAESSGDEAQTPKVRRKPKNCVDVDALRRRQEEEMRREEGGVGSGDVKEQGTVRLLHNIVWLCRSLRYSTILYKPRFYYYYYYATHRRLDTSEHFRVCQYFTLYHGLI